MPTYEYRCDKCGNEFEAIQKITDDPLKSCTKCGGQVQRLIAATNFILKGGGWYKTDYASGPTESDAKPAGCSAEKAGPQCGTCPANTD
ncbi:zinc ribbon domain-containing protein [bacterium]|nr:MAG: zinc ribbon domain-containing protein [bacterium]